MSDTLAAVVYLVGLVVVGIVGILFFVIKPAVERAKAEASKQAVDEVCKNCRFWQAPGNPGQCRRRAPNAVDGWPLTLESDSCGEFEKKP